MRKSFYEMKEQQTHYCFAFMRLLQAKVIPFHSTNFRSIPFVVSGGDGGGGGSLLLLGFAFSFSRSRFPLFIANLYFRHWTMPNASRRLMKAL